MVAQLWEHSEAGISMTLLGVMGGGEVMLCVSGFKETLGVESMAGRTRSQEPGILHDLRNKQTVS